jgi:hypothetical protein
MKILLVAAVAIGALAMAASDGKADARSGASEWETRVEQVDSYLSEGLSGDTHRKIAGPARDGADAFVAFGGQLSTFTE